MWFYVFHWKKTWNFILKFREIFAMEKNSAQCPQNEIWWKAIFLSNLCDCFREMVHVVINRYLKKNISERFEDFSYPEAITDSPFNSRTTFIYCTRIFKYIVTFSFIASDTIHMLLNVEMFQFIEENVGHLLEIYGLPLSSALWVI